MADADDWNIVCEKLQPFAARWEQVAQRLGFPALKIEEFKKYGNDRALQCLNKAIQCWIEQDYNTQRHGLPSWRTLCKAISKVEGMSKLARDLAKAHRGVVPLGKGASGNEGGSNGCTAAVAEVCDEDIQDQDVTIKSTTSASTQTSSEEESKCVLPMSVRSNESNRRKIEDLKFTVHQELEKLKKKFITFQCNVRESLSGVCHKRIITHVLSDYANVCETREGKATSLFSDADKLKLDCATSVNEVFIVLQRYWTFIKCDMLISIVSHYGDSDDHEKMKEYQTELKVFFQNRKLTEIPEELMSSASVDDVHEKMVLKLDVEDPNWKEIKDFEYRMCQILGIKPSALFIVGFREGCVEILFNIPRHISKQLFEVEALTRKQCDSFRSASVLSLSCGHFTEIFQIQKKTFKSVMCSIAKELDDDTDLISKLKLDSGLRNQNVNTESLSGLDFIEKLQENGWISPENPFPLFDLLEKVNRKDIVDKAKQDCIKHMALIEHEIKSDKRADHSEEGMVKVVSMKYSDSEIIKEYLLELDKKGDDYFDLKLAPKLHKANETDHDEDEVDSDYESELTSLCSNTQEKWDGSTTESFSECLSDINDQEDKGDKTEVLADCLSAATTSEDAFPFDQNSFQRQTSEQPSLDRQISKSFDTKFDVECTMQVLKKLKHKKTPEYLLRAVHCTVFNDLACGRHWVQVTTKNKEHQLFQRKVLQGKVTILWERAIQFSPKLSTENVDVYVDVIRLWDIVLKERSYQIRVNAIEKSWSQERKLNVSETLRPYRVQYDQSQSKAFIPRVFKRVLSESKDLSDIQLFPATDPSQFKPVTLREFPKKVNFQSLSSHKFEFPLKMWPEEHRIVNIDSVGPVIVLGRSGTGKTTCCLYRMIQEFLSYKKGGCPLRQLFVTKNQILCNKFQTQFERLIEYHASDSDCNLVEEHDSSPLFMTLEDLLMFIDHNLEDAFASEIEDTLQNNANLDNDSDSETTQPQSYICLTDSATKIFANDFVNNIWKDISKHGQRHNFDPEVVWMEIKSFIKGFRPTEELSEEEYINLSPKIAPNFAEQRREVYEIYKQYKKYCRDMKRLRNSKQHCDEGDLVFNMYKGLVYLKEHHKNIDWLFDSLYVDEVQDFTQSEVLLLVQCCKSSMCNIFLTGDTAQTVMRDVSFRFKDLKTSFFVSDDLPTDKAPPIHELTINYRSHSGILNLAGHVMEFLQRFFPHSVDRAPQDRGMLSGPMPKFIQRSCSSESLILIFGANMRNASDIPFGHDQAVIVRTEQSKKSLPFKEADVQVFSVYESKGLEYDDVLLYNFFSGCAEVKSIWKIAYKSLLNSEKTPQSMLQKLNSDLKHLYTAITRAKVNLWIYESEAFDDHDLPILSEWKNGVDGNPLIEVIDPDDPAFNFEQVFATARKSTPSQWKSQGDTLRNSKKWKQAALCYRKAGRFDLEAKTEAMALEADPNASRSLYQKRALAYIKVYEITGDVTYLVKVADNLRNAAKSREDLIDVSKLYNRLKKEQESVKTLVDGKLYVEASNLLEEYGRHQQAIETLLEGKLYVQAAAKAKKFENQDKISKDCNLSSNHIAREHILKYCRPPIEMSESDSEGGTFYGLLQYIEDEDFQIVILKHANRFMEALKRHFTANHTAKFYRSAFAQGSNLLASENKSPFATTYYDSALRLSLVHGHVAINSALVIHSGRAFFSATKQYSVFNLIQLERLLSTSQEVATQLNAHLLLARFDLSRTKQAVAFCRQHKSLPGEIELLLSHLHKEVPPGLACTSLCDQYELLGKIQYLLSLNENSLIAQYKDILGLYIGDRDELYNEQRRFHKGDEQVEKQESSETYYAIKEHPFIIDCYLLPHESQDIWLQNLTQGKLAKSRDNDGMFVIPKRLLFGKITGHLKGCQKFLAKGFNLSRFVSQLNPIPVQQSCVHFDTEAAKLNLKVCTYFLHNAVNDQLTNDAVKGLRQYHSVANVYHFPLCENFMSHISLIRRDAWKVFQSETKQWIISQISEPGPHEFDFLTLWEQASVAKMNGILRKHLEVPIAKESTNNCTALSRTSLFWLDICDRVVNEPFEACREFFDECLPELLQISNISFNSIINVTSIYGTIVLTLISCMFHSSLIFPHAYARALSVYESLLVNNKTPILRACFHSSMTSKFLRDEILEVLHKALNRVIFSLLGNATAVCKSDYQLRQCLVLALCLFTNYVRVNPKSMKIPKLFDDLVSKLSHTNTSELNFNYQAVCVNIQQAKSTADLINIIEHLLCPTPSKRYEAMASVSMQRVGIGIHVLSEVELRKSMPNVIIKRSQHKKIPEFTEPCPELVVSPLIPERERIKELYFVLDYQYFTKYSLGSVESDSTRPPWMNISENGAKLADPGVIEFVDLGFLTPKKQSNDESNGICSVCKVRRAEGHSNGDIHLKNLGLYKQFSALHDTDYSRCASKLKKVSKSTKAEKEVDKFLERNEKVIIAIYRQGDWTKGINLLTTSFIPTVKDMTHKYLRHI